MLYFKNNSLRISQTHLRCDRNSLPPQAVPNASGNHETSRYSQERECAASISQTTHDERRKKELRAARYVGKHRGRNYERMRYDDVGETKFKCA